MTGEQSPFGPSGIAGGPLTEVNSVHETQGTLKLTEAEIAEIKPSSTVLELRRHVEQRWPFWACTDAAEACGDDLDACVDWLKRAHPGTGPQAHRDARAFVGGAVTRSEWLEVGREAGWLARVEDEDPEPSKLHHGVMERRVEVQLAGMVFGNTKTWPESAPEGFAEYMWHEAWREIEQGIGRWLRGEPVEVKL